MCGATMRGMVGNKHWSESEIQQLQQHYEAIGNARLTELLSDRTEKAIRQQAHRLGVKKCTERLVQMGHENIKGAFKQPPDIEG
jgi:hypothetical protein